MFANLHLHFSESLPRISIDHIFIREKISHKYVQQYISSVHRLSHSISFSLSLSHFHSLSPLFSYISLSLPLSYPSSSHVSCCSPSPPAPSSPTLLRAPSVCSLFRFISRSPSSTVRRSLFSSEETEQRRVHERARESGKERERE